MPSVQQIIARSACAYSRATSSIAEAGTPVSFSATSSVYFSTQLAKSSYPVVARLMNSMFASPEWMIHRDQPRAIAHAAQQVMKEDRMSLPRVRAPQDDEVGVLSLAVRARSSTGSEHCRQTGDAWSVSSPVTAVDVVAVHRDASELLRDVVHLVALFGAAEHTESIRALVPGGRDAGLRPLERLFPRGRAQPPVISDQRFRQTDKPVIHQNENIGACG